MTAGLLAAVTYLNILPNDYADDGIPIVEQNPLIHEPGRWADLWTTDYWHMARDATPQRDLLYRPLALTTFRLVAALFGDGPTAQHAVNILLHVLVTVGVVRLARALHPEAPVPWFAGLFFAVLPIHSEVIANVVGRADLFAALGTLGALRAFDRMTQPCRRAPEERCRSHRVVPCLILALCVFAALSAKESGVAVMVLLPLWCAVLRRRIRAAWVLAVIVPAILYFALRYHALEGNLIQKPALTKTVNMLVDAPPWQRVLGALQLWGLYGWKTVWPAVLNVNYSINALRPATTVGHPLVLLGMSMLVVLVTTAWRAWQRGDRRVLLLSASVLLAYLPTANLLVLIQVSFAERIWYLPSAFVCLLIGWLLRDSVRRTPVGIVVAMLVTAMMIRTAVRNREWRDNLALYAAACRDAPDAVGALRLYGNELVAAGQYAEGIALLRRAVEIDLGFTDAHRSLGQGYLLAGNVEMALYHLQIADMQIPGHPATQAALRTARDAIRAKTEPELEPLRRAADFAAATSPDATDPSTEIALIRALRETGRLEEALRRFEQTTQRYDRSANWHYERAVTLVTANRLDEAIAAYERSAELDPMPAAPRIEQAMLRLERRAAGDLERTAQLVEQVLQQAPDLPEALVCRAELAALRGDLSSAARDYAQALSTLDPTDPRRPFWTQRARTLGGG